MPEVQNNQHNMQVYMAINVYLSMGQMISLKNLLESDVQAFEAWVTNPGTSSFTWTWSLDGKLRNQTTVLLPNGVAAYEVVGHSPSRTSYQNGPVDRGQDMGGYQG